MNKHIKLLIESFFDDEIFDSPDDLETNLDDLGQLTINEIVKDLEKLLIEINIKNKRSFLSWSISDIKDQKIHVDIDNDTNTCISYYNSITKQRKEYITSMSITDTNIFNKLINLLSSLNIKNFYTQIVYNNRGIDNIQDTLDFKNIQFDGYILKSVNIKNLTVDKNTLYKSYLQKEYKSYNLRLLLENCTLENVQITNADYIKLNKIKNLKDFSFIKKINNELTIKYLTNDDLPECNNLQGLPSGEYKLYINYMYDYDNYISEVPVQSLKGLPNNLTYVNVDVMLEPWNFLQYFSFEGLTNEILPNFKFTAHRFKGKNNYLTVQLGPYNLQVDGRTWKPTKPQYQTIINTQDWFLDCYKTEPHKEYIPPTYTNEHKKELKKIQKYNQNIKDQEEDAKLMIDKIKTLLKENKHYYSISFNKRSLTIEKFGSTKIQFNISTADIRYPTIHRYIKSYIDFLKWIKNSDYLDNDSGKTLHELIIGSVEKRRERINKKRKEQEKEQRKQEKLQLKQNNTNTEKNTQQKQITQQTQQNTTNNKLNIDIVDYSTSSIAIFGKDSFYIKDQLKELGAKFNKFLTRDDKKVAGWIISKRKQKDVENIINNYQN